MIEVWATLAQGIDDALASDTFQAAWQRIQDASAGEWFLVAALALVLSLVLRVETHS